MKHFLLCMSLFIGGIVTAQQPNKRIVITYNLDSLDGSPKSFPRNIKDFPTSGSVTIRWMGKRANDCAVIINGTQINVQNGVEEVTVDNNGRLPSYRDITFRRPFTVYMLNDGFELKKITIPSDDQPAAQTPSNASSQQKQQQLNKRNADVAGGAQLLWQDALSLNHALDENNDQLVVKILSKYYTGEDYNALLKSIEGDKNVFLQNVLPSRWPLLIDSEATLRQNGESLTPQASELGSAVNVPQIAIDAIGSFIAKRLIDELNRAYLDRFRAQLDSNQDLKTMLPETANLLVTIGTNNMIDYKGILTGLRQNLLNDLANLCQNTPKLIKNHKKEIIESGHNTDWYVAALTMLEITNALQQNSTPAEVLHRLAKYDFTLDPTKEQERSSLQSSIRLAGAISDHLRIKDPYGLWIDIDKQFQNTRTVYLFAGLIFKQDRALFDGNMIKIKGNWVSLTQAVQGDNSKIVIDFIYQIAGLLSEVKEITGQETSDSSKYLALTERMLNLVATIPAVQDETEFKNVFEYVQKIVQIRTKIVEKNFVAAGTIAFELIEKLVPNGNIEKGKKEFFRYLSFAQNLIDAKNKEELIAALEQAADPVGNFRLKRQYPFTASITSYPGLFAGREQYDDTVNDDEPINTYGFTAPLGLAFSISGNNKGPGIREYGAGKTADPKPSFTVFFPIIDVGAITALRLYDQKTELPPVTWDGFLAPGLFINYGFKKSILTIHAGAQLAPAIQNLSGVARPRLWRFGIGVSADLHLWSIYTKDERKACGH